MDSRIYAIVATLLCFISTILHADQVSDEQFGRELPITSTLGCGRSMDAAIADNYLYVVGQQELRIADLTHPESPHLVGRLPGLGGARQIAVKDGVAYVTSREDGVFIIDVSQPAQPQVLCHYDSAGLATGVAVSGDVLMIASTFTGVELVDVSDPRRPEHLSTVRTGEAQSVTAQDGVMYVGVWHSRELVICDIRNPRDPAVLARAPLDGYGDGVDVRGRYCFVATGHHSRQHPNSKPGDPGYGRGHGLEIIDITTPGEPRHVSRVKLPAFYRLGMDMWDVTVSGDYAFIADTFNGMFVVNISRIDAPRVVAHRQLPAARDEIPSPAAGLAVGDGYVYVAGAWSDLHVIEAGRLAHRVVPEADRAPEIPPRPKTEPDSVFDTYLAGGQVHAVAALSEDTAVIAAGMAGLQVIGLRPHMHRIAGYFTDGFALDVQVAGNYVHVAEGMGGLSIWKRDDSGGLVRISRYRASGQSIKQVVVPPPGQYALVHVGANRLEILDVSDPQHPARVLDDTQLGLMYFAPLARGLLGERYAACQWHVTGIYFYDLYNGSREPRFSGYHFEQRVNAEDGMTFLKDHVLVIRNGRYVLADPQENRPLDELPHNGIQNVTLTGKPTIFGETLYVANRRSGSVCALNISDPRKPRLLDHRQLKGNPGMITAVGGQVLIPAGYQGLLNWHLPGE